MRNAVILLSAVSVLFITGCIKKYTCAEAPFHCPSCRSDSADHINIPWTVLDTAVPQACILSLKILPVKDVSESGSPEIDMQSMVAAYRSLNDRNHEFNLTVQKCFASLTEQNTRNDKARQEYCRSRSYTYDTARGVCVLKP